MPTTRPFAYNTGSTISQTEQVGNLAIGTGATLNYGDNYGGVDWWMGPDEDLGYVVAYQAPSGQPNDAGKTAKVGFWRTDNKTDNEFINLGKYLSNFTQNFNDVSETKNWLNTNGYWTSYVVGTDVTPSPTPNWDNPSSVYPPNRPTTNTQTIQGITAPINLYWEFSLAADGSFYYSKNSGEYTLIGQNVNFSVSNNDTLSFRFIPDDFNSSTTIRIRNASDGNAILDTIQFTQTYSGG